MVLRSEHESYISLCTGAGGLDLGVGLALRGARTVCYVEHEVTACEVLAARIADGALDDAPIWTDLHTFDGKPWRGKVAGIVGGYPCQPFSVAGKRLGTADPRHLWPSISRIIAECGPSWCFFENVGGHLRLGYFDVVRPDLERLGYCVTEGLFTAAEVGAPHQRERLFILAVADPGCAEWRTLTAAGHLAHGDAGWEEEAGRVAESGDIDVAHARRERRQQDAGRASREEAGSHGGDESEHRGKPDVEHAARAQRAWAAGSGVDGERWAASRPGAGDGAVDDAGLTRLERRCRPFPERAYELPPFPPGPSDHERWAAILRERPDLAPATEPGVRGVAHELARGLDLPRAARLRLTGNGVVPLQAAFAFITLARQLGGGHAITE